MAKRVIFSREARADIRSIAKPPCGCSMAWPGFWKLMQATSSSWKGFEPPRFRLRIGDWRYIFRKSGKDAIEILHVRHRREAYR